MCRNNILDKTKTFVNHSINYILLQIKSVLRVYTRTRSLSPKRVVKMSTLTVVMSPVICYVITQCYQHIIKRPDLIFEIRHINDRYIGVISRIPSHAPVQCQLRYNKIRFQAAPLGASLTEMSNSV